MNDRMLENRDAVVVPSDHGSRSLAFIRSLGRAGYRVVGVATDEAAPPLESKYCVERHTVPGPGQDLRGYRDALLEYAAREDALTIPPLCDLEVHVLSNNRAAFAREIATPWGGYASVRQVQDRFQLFQLAEAAGVRAPKTALLDQWDSWDEATVVKPRYALAADGGTAATRGGRRFEPGEEPGRETIVREMGHEPVVQERIPTAAEYGFTALCEDGEPVASFQHQRIRSGSYAGGASVYRESVDIPDLASAGRRILTALDWDGPAMVKFHQDQRDGAFKLMGVCPRFGESVSLAIHAGVDFPSLYCRLAAGEFSGPPPDYETGVGCHVLPGEISHLKSVLGHRVTGTERPPSGRTVLDVAASIASEPNFDYLSLDDGAPFVRALLNTVGSAQGTSSHG
jgi:predicted ATP-grasp superfamily ATP-dependent carboligase